MLKGKNATISCLLEEQYQQASFLHVSLQDQANMATHMAEC